MTGDLVILMKKIDSKQCDEIAQNIKQKHQKEMQVSKR